MAGYSPLKITGMSTGLVQSREEFLLPDDAYPTLQNAYVWRERIKRKRGYELLGRLQRKVTVTGNLTAAEINLIAALSLESTATIVAGSISIVGGTDGTTYTDPNKDGILLATGGTGVGGSINYATGALVITAGANQAITGTISYYPGLPVMGIRIQELKNSAVDQTIFFDQKYAYRYTLAAQSFEEFIPGTTWNAHNASVTGTDFFWSTNYWVSATVLPGTAIAFFGTTNNKLFWVTNNTGSFGVPDPIRITDGSTWVDFVPPNFGQIDATTYLVQCLSFLPFRGRLVTFNTYEGPGPGITGATNYSNRIRWSTIGNPFIPYSVGPPSKGSWRDDIRGQGGFLDIPTSEDIISVGFVRDNLVIYCERSTWQLRYNGRSIAPFQIERVNSELGGEGPFSAIQFDTSLVGIGDKGIVECDSFKSERIDIKIPDYVFKFQIKNNAAFRVHGIRDFINRLAYWTVPIAADQGTDANPTVFPTQRLVYNYENDSWALFNDSLTTLGTFQPLSGRNWLNTHAPWIECNFPWLSNQNQGIPAIVGGNQQGFVEYLDIKTVNDASLYLKNIVGHATSSTTGTPTVVTSPNHNMTNEFVIGISGIPNGTPYDNLNGGIFGIIVIDTDSFQLMRYNAVSMDFSTPQLDVPGDPYIGNGLINIRENFSIISKKFNFLDEGNSIQMGYIDILMESTDLENPGAITLLVYLDYNDEEPSNTLPMNETEDYSNTSNSDTFFNSVIPTAPSLLNGTGGAKFWQRVYCATRANFLTLEYTLSNAQMAGIEQTKDVQIDAQILWIRKSGRMSQI